MELINLFQSYFGPSRSAKPAGPKQNAGQEPKKMSPVKGKSVLDKKAKHANNPPSVLTAHLPSHVLSIAWDDDKDTDDLTTPPQQDNQNLFTSLKSGIFGFGSLYSSTNNASNNAAEALKSKSSKLDAAAEATEAAATNPDIPEDRREFANSLFAKKARAYALKEVTRQLHINNPNASNPNASNEGPRAHIEITDAGAVIVHTRKPTAVLVNERVQRKVQTALTPIKAVKEKKREYFPKDIGNNYFTTENNAGSTVKLGNPASQQVWTATSATRGTVSGGDVENAVRHTVDVGTSDPTSVVGAEFGIVPGAVNTTETVSVTAAMYGGEATANDKLVENFHGWERFVFMGSNHRKDKEAFLAFNKAAKKVPKLDKSVKDTHCRQVLQAVHDIFVQAPALIVGGVTKVLSFVGEITSIVAAPLAGVSALITGAIDVVQGVNDLNTRKDKINAAKLKLMACDSMEKLHNGMAEADPKLAADVRFRCMGQLYKGSRLHQERLKNRGKRDKAAAITKIAYGPSKAVAVGAGCTLAAVGLGPYAPIPLGIAAFGYGINLVNVKAHRYAAERHAIFRQQDAAALFNTMSRADLEEAIAAGLVLPVAYGQGTYCGGETTFEGLHTALVDLCRNEYVDLHMKALYFQDMIKDGWNETDVNQNELRNFLKMYGMSELEMKTLLDVAKNMTAQGKDPLDFIKVHLASVMDIEFKTDPAGNEKLSHVDVYAQKFYATMLDVASENGSKTAKEISAAFTASMDNKTDFDLKAKIAKHYIAIVEDLAEVNKSLDVLVAKKMFIDDEGDPDDFLTVMTPFEKEIEKVRKSIGHGVNSPSIDTKGLPNQALNGLLSYKRFVADNLKAIKGNVPEFWRDDAYRYEVHGDRYEIYADKFHQILYQIALEHEVEAAIDIREKFVSGIGIKDFSLDAKPSKINKFQKVLSKITVKHELPTATETREKDANQMGNTKDFSLEDELYKRYTEIEAEFNSRDLSLNTLVAERLFKGIDVDDFENAMTDRTVLMTPLAYFKAHVADNKESIKKKQPELRRKAANPADDPKAQARNLLRSNPEKGFDPSRTMRKEFLDPENQQVKADPAIPAPERQAGKLSETESHEDFELSDSRGLGNVDNMELPSLDEHTSESFK